MYLDELPDLEQVEECPDEGDDEAGHDHEQEEVVLAQARQFVPLFQPLRKLSIKQRKN